jgi:hypothetical protein
MGAVGDDEGAPAADSKLGPSTAPPTGLVELMGIEPMTSCLSTIRP